MSIYGVIFLRFYHKLYFFVPKFVLIFDGIRLKMTFSTVIPKHKIRTTKEMLDLSLFDSIQHSKTSLILIRIHD